MELKHWCKINGDQERKIKVKRKILAIFMVAAIMLTGCSSKPEGAVAKVNGDYITKEVFDKEFEIYRNMVYPQMTDEDLSQDAGNGKSLKAELAGQVVDTLVMDKIIKDEFDKLKLEIPQEEKDEAINTLIEQSGGEEAFNSQLEEMGLAREDMEAMVEKTLIQAKLRDNYIEDHKKTPEEIQAYFDNNKEVLVTYDVSHILVETEEEAKAIKKDLDGGADFAELAKEKSTDSGSAALGGELGEITMQTNFVQPFLDAVKEMKEGQVSDPVESEFGFHIIKVNSIKDDVADHEEAIQKMLLDADLNAYMQGLYESADIETYKPSM